MSWLTDFVKPKLRKLVGRDVPDNLWHKCPGCAQMLFHRDLAENMHVCTHCNHHMRLSGKDRLTMLLDTGSLERVTLPPVGLDPIKFKDLKKYTDRHKEARHKTHEEDALLVAFGTMHQVPVVVAVMDFSFMGGSMGTAVGEGILRAADEAIRRKCPFVIVTASGGARMQEGILSLMQMPRSTIAVQQMREASLPFIVVLTDPTTGGVSASFAMLGDVALAETGATVAFTGARVIQQTIREELPLGFQTAEYLQEHGMVDQVVHRRDLKQTLATLMGLLMKRAA